jgi:hypothetical protein
MDIFSREMHLSQIWTLPLRLMSLLVIECSEWDVVNLLCPSMSRDATFAARCPVKVLDDVGPPSTVSLTVVEDITSSDRFKVERLCLRVHVCAG